MKEVHSPVNTEERKKLDIRPGDTVRVSLKIVEGEKTRLQAFEGLVLAVKHGKEAGGTFTVRKVASGVGVEKIFPIYSPVIEKIELMRRAKVRRAKLYYVRDKAAREIKRQMRNLRKVTVVPEILEEKPEEIKAEEVVK
jgi:large subunit ribosomal protein L19